MESKPKGYSLFNPRIRWQLAKDTSASLEYYKKVESGLNSPFRAGGPSEEDKKLQDEREERLRSYGLWDRVEKKLRARYGPDGYPKRTVGY